MSTFNIGTSANQNIPTWSLQIDGVNSTNVTLPADTEVSISVPMSLNPTDAIIQASGPVFVSTATPLLLPSGAATPAKSRYKPVAVKLLKVGGERVSTLYFRSRDSVDLSVEWETSEPIPFNWNM
jgi:hypothetical protein